MFNLIGVVPLLLRLVIKSNGVQSQNVTCQQNWTLYGDHCYWSVPGLKTKWEDAQNDCRSRDSNLVKVETSEENSWLKTFATLSDYPWIGANDRGEEGDWRWISDNTKVTFTNWLPNQPDDGSGSEDCVHLSLGAQWNDDQCYSLSGFICEKKDFQISQMLGRFAERARYQSNTC